LRKSTPRKPAKGGKSDTVSLAEVLRVYVMEHAPATAKPKLIAEHVEGLTDFWARRRFRHQGRVVPGIRRDQDASMARRELETLRAAVNYFHKEYGLDPVPAFTMPPKHRARERWLSRAEAAALLWQARRTPHVRGSSLLVFTQERALAPSWGCPGCHPSRTAGLISSRACCTAAAAGSARRRNVSRR
jgi:hypothetical protein